MTATSAARREKLHGVLAMKAGMTFPRGQPEEVVVPAAWGPAVGNELLNAAKVGGEGDEEQM